MSLPISTKQRHEANALIDATMKRLATLAEARNIDHEARAAINRARDEISLAETLIANQPSQP